MSLRIPKQNLKEHFLGLGFDAEIDHNAPEAPWENTAVVLRRNGHSGVSLVISISRYTNEIVEIERRIEGGSEASLILKRLLETPRSPLDIEPMKVPTRHDDTVTDTTGISTLEELTSLVKELSFVRGEAPGKENQVSTIDLSSATINVNREINRGSRDSQRSTQQAKKQVR